MSPRAVCSRRRRTVALSSTSRGFVHRTSRHKRITPQRTRISRGSRFSGSLSRTSGALVTPTTRRRTLTGRASRWSHFGSPRTRLPHSGHAIVCASHGRIPCGVPRWLFAEPLDPPCPERSYILSAPPSLQVCDAPLRPAGLAAGLDSTPTRSHDVQDTRDRAMTMPSQRADRSDRHGSMCRHHTPVAPRLCPQPP